MNVLYIKTLCSTEFWIFLKFRLAKQVAHCHRCKCESVHQTSLLKAWQVNRFRFLINSSNRIWESQWYYGKISKVKKNIVPKMPEFLIFDYIVSLFLHCKIPKPSHLWEVTQIGVIPVVKLILIARGHDTWTKLSYKKTSSLRTCWTVKFLSQTFRL